MVDDLVVDEEVDVYGCIVLCDVGLSGDVYDVFPEVDLLEAIDEGDEEAKTGALQTEELAQPEGDHSFVLFYDDYWEQYRCCHLMAPF